MSVGEQTIDMTSGGEGPQGGHAKWTQESGEFTLKSGEYTLHVEQSNIDYDPKEKNLSICDYDLKAYIDKEGPATAAVRKSQPVIVAILMVKEGAALAPGRKIKEPGFRFWEHFLRR